MMNNLGRSICLLFISLLLTSGAFAQQIQTFTIGEMSTMKVEGTSSLHDWHCDVKEIQGSVGFSEAEGLFMPQEVMIEIPVKSMDSGKGMMNKLMYKSLKEKNYPSISYQLTEIKISENPPSGNQKQFLSKGELEIAGKKQQIEMLVDLLKGDDNEYLFEGSKMIKMTDFGIEPPKAMFGAVTTGDEIKVSFVLKVPVQ